MSARVDVLAILQPYAQDTGAFRVTNKGAAELATACAAVAELLAANENLIELCHQIMCKPAENQELQDAIKALARCKGES